jgi:hypothetical protein
VTTTKATVKRIKRALTKWMKPLGLEWWDVTVECFNEPADILLHFKASKDHIVPAIVFADWQYGTATILFNVPAFDGKSDDEIERIVVHELLHILVNEMREGEIHHEERVVSQLTKAIFWVTAAAKKEG